MRDFTESNKVGSRNPFRNKRTFEHYLSSRVAPSTAKKYVREVALFFSSFEPNKESRQALLKTKSEGEQTPQTATYQEIMAYIGQLRKKYTNLSSSLQALKHYYQYLLSIGQREDNPAKSIRLRDKTRRDIQVQDLFSPEELERVLEKKERYPRLKNRNQLIISLLIYQGITNGELVNLELENINLEQGTIHIKPGRKTNGRTLKLNSKQVFWIMNYLQKDRPKLLKVETEKLIISKLGTEETGEGIGYIVATQKHLFPDRKLNAQTIRQSVITNLLKQGKDLRLVQAFAGHKYPSTTERYKQTQVEQLKNQLLKYHPLQ